MSYFTDIDIIGRLFFERPYFDCCEYHITGTEGSFGDLKFDFFSQDGKYETSIIFRVFIKNIEEMKRITKQALLDKERIIKGLLSD